MDGGADMEFYPAAAKDVVLLALALYGAILATAIWRHWARRDAARLRIAFTGLERAEKGNRVRPALAAVLARAG